MANLTTKNRGIQTRLIRFIFCTLVGSRLLCSQRISGIGISTERAVVVSVSDASKAVAMQCVESQASSAC